MSINMSRHYYSARAILSLALIIAILSKPLLGQKTSKNKAYYEAPSQTFSQLKSSLTIQALSSKDPSTGIDVFTSGTVTEGFDPSIPSQTCKASPMQIKVYDPETASEEKRLYQDFTLALSKEASASAMELRLVVSGVEDPFNPEVTPKNIKVSSDKVQKFSVMYNCRQLLADSSKPYYDTVKVIVSPYNDAGSQ